MQVKESENDPNHDGRGCYSHARERGRPDVYVLTAAKGGPKLDPNQDGADLEAGTGAGCKHGYRNFPMSLFAHILSGDVDDTVVDQTGLTGSYDFTLTALREQLGLELNRRKTLVELLAIDHAIQYIGEASQN
jgi:hypothetical protein